MKYSFHARTTIKHISEHAFSTLLPPPPTAYNAVGGLFSRLVVKFKNGENRMRSIIDNDVLKRASIITRG
jgi:hypothetical protein